MKKTVYFQAMRILMISSLFFLISCPLRSQKLDSLLSKAEQWKLKHLMKGLSLDVYMDAYFVGNIGGSIPTSHTYEFQTNSPFINEVRVNMFDLDMNFNNDWARMTADFRIGDQPLLLSSSTAQWTNYLTEASLGFSFIKGLWIDLGYLDSPIGVESSMPINNILSTCTVGTYYEPSSVLGGYLSYTNPDNSWCWGAWVGNAFTLPGGKNTQVQYGLDISYNPSDAITISFNNDCGNTAKSGATYTKYVAFNNLYAQWNPASKWNLIGQTDFAFQRVSSREKDSVRLGTMVSGLLGAKFYFLPRLAFALRAELFYDPEEIFIGSKYSGKTDNFVIFGASAGLEFNPGKDAYIRLQYNFLSTGDPGVKPFNEVTSSSPSYHYWADYNRQCYSITTGIRF